MTTHFADSVAVGLVGTPQAPFTSRTNLSASSSQGVPLASLVSYSVVPLALLANNFRAAAAIAGAGSVTIAAGTSLTSGTINDNGTTRTVIVMDVPRNLRFTSSANDTGITFTVTGFDVYGAPMTETITGANGIASGRKAFKYVLAVTASGASAGTVAIGTGDVLGLPFRVNDASYVVSVKWAATLAADAGTFVAADTATATATTGDVRGTYIPSSASNASRRLTIVTLVADIDTGAGAYGVTQF